MNVGQSLRIALRALGANKMRALLTMLGIIIGVGTVIVLMSVGEGVEGFVTGQLQGLGSNLVFVVPGSLEENPDGKPRPANLTYKDALAIADPLLIQDVLAVVPEVSRPQLVVHGKQEANTTISGVTPEYEVVRNFFVEEDEFITDEAMHSRSRVEWPRERHIQDRLSTAPCWAMKGSLPHVTGSHEAVQSRPDLPAPCTPGSLGSHSGTC